MNERQKRIDQLKSLMSAFADPIDEVIYHYTSAEGLRGIIENSEIWLTNVSFVNDMTECKALQEEKDLFDDNDFTNKLVRDCWKDFIDYSHNDYDTYIASFSRGDESLDQWRGYGNFRIGFEANNLRLLRKIHGRLLVQEERQVYDTRQFLPHSRCGNHKLFW